MATPIAHKGATAGAKVQALTILDFILNSDLRDSAWDYFRNVQGKDTTYIPFISDTDTPAVHLNKDIMDRYRSRMKEFYFDPTRFKTYLEQLGITYPTVRN
jgi:aminobenzoyl-glutamate utilization protein B